MAMQKICAWCGKSLSSLRDPHTSGISHGICNPCAKVFLEASIPQSLGKLVRILAVPNPNPSYLSKI